MDFELHKLSLMEYISSSSVKTVNAFFDQFNKIYMYLWEKKYTTQKVFWDPTTFLMIQLLSFMNVNKDCIIKNTFASMEFIPNWYTDIEMDIPLFEEKIKKCLLKKKTKVVLPFIITMKEGSHANLLILNTSEKIAYRIEPNYGNDPFIKKYNTAIENRLESFFPTIGYRYGSFLPTSCKKLYHGGLCLFIAVLRYVYPKLTNEILKKTIINFFRSELKTL